MKNEGGPAELSGGWYGLRLTYQIGSKGRRKEKIYLKNVKYLFFKKDKSRHTYLNWIISILLIDRKYDEGSSAIVTIYTVYQTSLSPLPNLKTRWSPAVARLDMFL